MAPALALWAASAVAEFHTFKIEEIFSNADGTVQYVVMHESEGMSEENFWMGNAFTSTHLGTTQTYVFRNNLPGVMCGYYGCGGGGTANKRVLIATQGLADLHVITPDFVVPNGFFPIGGATLNYAGVDFVTYGPLPTDGKTALDRNNVMIPNVATNFAGASVSVTAGAAVDLNQHGLTGSWYEAVTGGQGVEVEVFSNPSSGTGSTFVSWFTYDNVVGGADHQRWYTAQGQVVTGQPNASLTIYQNTGGNFNAPPVTTAQPVGTATLSFETCTSGQLSYSFTDGTGRTGTIPLTRLTQNVTCSTTTPHPTNADFALSGNWFGGAATSGQGLTVEVNPNSSTVFAAWYTYAPNGAGAGAAGQRWYTAQPTTFAPGSRSIPVQIFETTGGMFDAPTPPGQRTVPVGSGTLAFQSCSAATFSYNFTGGSSSGLSGTIALSRVGDIVPPGCTS
jgi:hypothetical protein